jgi:MFS family permease
MALLRLLAGIGMGTAMPNTTTLLSEYAPQRRRSLMITIMFTGFNLGSAAIGFSARYLIPLHRWRSVQLRGGAPPWVGLRRNFGDAGDSSGLRSDRDRIDSARKCRCDDEGVRCTLMTA